MSMTLRVHNNYNIIAIIICTLGYFEIVADRRDEQRRGFGVLL